ncbi:putative DNA-binding pseudobarrel domain-containing protein [Medicago truncatula]|uniref:E1 protein n=1 Tax=Medicago truncatula TaxID=3880 RepID=G7IDI5_MEDTR|nr:E1 protein [Medicago truncatula]RHN78845.1 putative DNA-binding pseudobarrel domain-containing protein [Medicago truncatula]
MSYIYPFNTTCTHLSLGVCPCPKLNTQTYHIGRRWWGYSTKLMLFDDPWKIKKVLQEDDIVDKLLLDKDLVEELVLPVLSAGADLERGALVRIFDYDTESMHVLVHKRCVSSGNYGFFDNWFYDFVRRRGLKKGDEIGFHWDPYMKHFNFSVLFRTIRM